MLVDFADAMICQTWSYGAARWGEKALSHIVLRKDDDIVAAAQVRIVVLPWLRRGIAYVSHGPMWIRRGNEPDRQALQQMLQAMKQEYVDRRGLHLRIMPNDFSGAPTGETVAQELVKEGFEYRINARDRTLLMSVEPSMDELRKNLSSRWRKNLKSGEKKGLTIVEGTDIKLYDTFLRLFREMRERKRFADEWDADAFRDIQLDLPEPLKMRIFVCESEGRAVASIVLSLIGETGIVLLAATGNETMNLNASFVLQWRAVQWLKESGALWYDLCGIDPENNPGVYVFKCGLAGEKGKDVCWLGQFDACRSLTSKAVVKTADVLRAAHFSLRRGRAS
jgi:CelD/BcsL family acetyltransferase involved in cellulose biosynthesis